MFKMKIFILIDSNTHKYNTMSDHVCHNIVSFFAFIGACVFGIAGIIYGILALIPAHPFDEQMVTFGVTILVLSLVGITELVGALFGAAIGFIAFAIAYLVLRLILLIHDGIVLICCRPYKVQACDYASHV